MDESKLIHATIDERRVALMHGLIHSLVHDLATTHHLKMWTVCPLEMLGHQQSEKRIHNEAPKITPKMVCEELYGAALQHTMDMLNAGTVNDLIMRAKRMSAELKYIPFIDPERIRRRFLQKSDYGRKYREKHKERLARNQRERRNKGVIQPA